MGGEALSSGVGEEGFCGSGVQSPDDTPPDSPDKGRFFREEHLWGSKGGARGGTWKEGEEGLILPE